MTSEQTSIAVFVAVQMINVILSTIKSVLTVNGSRTTATLINTISYTFGAIITKMITEQSFEVVIAVTVLTNLVGVYLGRLITDHTRPTRLWTITATLMGDDAKDATERALRSREI